jgi:hypothetical protein
MLSVTQVLTGINETTADSSVFKARFAESVKVVLGVNADSVVVNSVTTTRRHLLSSHSSVTVEYTVIATNADVTNMKAAMMNTDALNTKINSYGYSVTAATPMAFANISPTSAPSSIPTSAASPFAPSIAVHALCFITSIALFMN